MERESSEDIENQAALLSALADSTRLKLIRLLAQQQEPNALCVNALAHHLGITQSAVSQHLKVLKSAGLVKGERRGYRIHYFINHEAMKKAKQQISGVLPIDEKPSENIREVTD
jgi:ArsR family transcriptional regulator